MDLANLLTRLRERPDTEHQAAFIRIVIALAASIYLAVTLHLGRLPAVQPWKIVAVIVFSNVYALSMITHIILFPQVCVPRRIVSIIVDLAITIFTIWLTAEAGLAFVAMFQFNAIGNGLRFGNHYLYLSCTLGVIGIVVLMFTSEFWAVHRTLGVGMLIATMVVPLYVANLIRNLHVALARLRTMATHDPLTGLKNRQGFYEEIARTLALAEKKRSTFAVIFVDLDGFKPVNDTLGHAAGDKMLKVVGQRLHEHVRKSDVVARIGGDEFVIIMRETSRTAIPAIADQVIRAVAMPYAIGGSTVTLTSSIGIAVYPENGRTVDELVAKADDAMYQSKRQGGGGYCMQGETELDGIMRRMMPSN
jgi:diguanylate cyclase (GGDEF)-like protein